MQTTFMPRADSKWPLKFRIVYLWTIFLRLFLFGDTIAIRVLMAAASIVFGSVLIVHPDTFDRKSFTVMALVVNQFDWGRALGPVVVWSALFYLHGFGVFWRIVERRARIGFAVAINWLGVVIWIAEFTLTNVALGEFAAGNALELPATVALFIALCRTGLNDEKIKP